MSQKNSELFTPGDDNNTQQHDSTSEHIFVTNCIHFWQFPPEKRPFTSLFYPPKGRYFNVQHRGMVYFKGYMKNCLVIVQMKIFSQFESLFFTSQSLHRLQGCTCGLELSYPRGIFPFDTFIGILSNNQNEF